MIPTRFSGQFAALLPLLLTLACGGPGAPPEPTLERAAALRGEGRLQEAEAELGGVLQRGIPGERDRAYTGRGCLRVERGDARGALEDLGKVHQLDGEGALCRGKAHALVAEHSEALGLLAPVVDGGDFDLETGQLAVRSALALRLVDEAARLAGLAVKKYPSDAPTVVLLAQAQAVTGDPAAALESLRQAELLDRQSPEAPFIRGNILWAMERYDDAAESFRLALERNPHFPEAARNLGVTLIQGGRYGDAVEALRSALAMRPDDLGIMNNLGVALASTGRSAEAASLYEEALKALPGEPRLLNNLVDVYIRLGRLDEARALLQDLVRKEPERANAQQRLRDLEAFETLAGTLCTEKEAVKATRQLLKARGWSHAQIVDSLERILSNPIFSAALEKKEAACRE